MKIRSSPEEIQRKKIIFEENLNCKSKNIGGPVNDPVRNSRAPVKFFFQIFDPPKISQDMFDPVRIGRRVTRSPTQGDIRGVSGTCIRISVFQNRVVMFTC